MTVQGVNSCPACEGSGRVSFPWPSKCGDCDGTGYINKGNILLDALEVITKRQANEDSFSDIATLWSWWLATEVKREDVPIMMTLLKLARHNNKPKRDDLVDACGYLALLADMEAGWKRRREEGEGKKEEKENE